MTKINFQHIFSQVFLHIKDIEINHDNILSDLKKLKWKISDFSKKNEITESVQILNLLKNKKIFKNILDKYIKIAIDKYFEYEIKHKIINVWGTKTLPGSESLFHKHIHFWLSFCYYPHGKKEDNFNIVFKNPNEFLFDIKSKNWNLYNSKTWTVPIEQGDLIIFPSTLLHKIGRNVSNEIRYSIAGNILPNGVIGIEDSKLLYNFK